MNSIDKLFLLDAYAPVSYTHLLINRPQITIENIAEHVSAFKRELDKISDKIGRAHV